MRPWDAGRTYACMEQLLAGSTCRSGGAVEGLQHAAQGVQAPGAQLLVVDAGVQGPGQLVAGLLHRKGLKMIVTGQETFRTSFGCHFPVCRHAPWRATISRSRPAPCSAKMLLAKAQRIWCMRATQLLADAQSIRCMRATQLLAELHTRPCTARSQFRALITSLNQVCWCNRRDLWVPDCVNDASNFWYPLTSNECGS